QRGAGSEAPGVVLALLVGDRSLIPPWAERLYQRAGTFHVIVISGAHVGLVAWFLYGGLRWLGLDQRPALVCLLVALPMYAWVCGGRPSVVRAVAMGVAVVGTRLLSLEVCLVNGLALAALFLLALRPQDLRDPGFQLSFLATAAIVGLASPLARRLRARLGRLGPLLAVSLAAQMAVLPVSAWHFQRLTPGAIVASLLAMPLALGSILAGALLVVVGPIPWLSAGVARMALLAVGGLTLSSRAVVGLPGGSVPVPRPGTLWMTAYLLALTAALLSRGARRWSGVAVTVLLTLALVWSPQPKGVAEMRLTVLDVGHGDALFLELPDGARLLVDGGGSYNRSFDIGEDVVVPYLLRRGVRGLDAVILTHSDLDHLGGLLGVVSRLRVREIWEGGSSWDRRSYRELRARALERGVKVRRLSAGEERTFGEVRLEILAAGGASSDPGNNDSVVLRLCYGKSKILLTGDAERQLEEHLLRWGGPLGADVLKVGHHGSRSSTTPAFLEAVRPRLALISTGASGPFRLPSARVLHRLRARDVTCLRTDRDGAITLRFDRQGRIRVRTYTNER
ncbi:MAG: DNA internalization-related competence protein ComEC/Rec2, partial [Acidobacteriota bacterium]